MSRLSSLSPAALNHRLGFKGYHLKRLSWGRADERMAEYIDLLIQGPPHPDNKLDRSGLASLRAYSNDELIKLIDGLGIG